MRVYERDKRWYVDFSYNGKRYRKAAGKTKRDALLKLGEIQRRIESKDANSVPVTAPRTFAGYAEEYLEYSLTHKKHSSYLRDVTSIRQLLNAFGVLNLSDITLRLIEQYQEIRARKVSPASVNRETQALKHMLRKATEWNYIQANPAQAAKKLREPAGRIRYLSLEERERLIKECSETLRDIVVTALETGMRKAEIEGLTWKDVDFERRTITLLRTKNNEIRTVPISNSLMPLLQRLHIERRGIHVFSKPDGTPYKSWRTAFETACRRAGIVDFLFHDLRHTFASYLVMASVDIRTVQELMGHRDIKMTMRYSHLSNAHLLEAINKVGTKMAQLTEISS